MTVAWVLALLISDGLDYRSAQSPVKDQNPRGTCAAFSVAAALETLPGTPPDLSEQFLYALVKKKQLDLDKLGKAFPAWAPQLREGDPLGEYAALFTIVGAPPEAVLPYQNGQVELPPGLPPDLAKFLSLAQITPEALQRLGEDWGKYGIAADGVRVLDGDQARDVARIQALLRAGVLAVPVAYTLYSPAWSLQDPKYLFGSDPAHPKFTPDHMEQFKREADLEWMRWSAARAAAGPKVDLAASLGPLVGRLGETKKGLVAWNARLLEPLKDAKGELLYGGHAVTIVGFDDDSFIIKNSWSPAWGEGGYARVSFDYHRLYATGALEVRSARVRLPALSPFERNARLAAAQLVLKVQPVTRGILREWRLSLTSNSMRDPPLEAVEYEVETEVAPGRWVSQRTQRVLARDVSAAGGFPWTLSGLALHAVVGSGARARVVARLGFDVTPDGAVLAWPATRTFGPFDTGAAQMVALTGR